MDQRATRHSDLRPQDTLTRRRGSSSPSLVPKLRCERSALVVGCRHRSTASMRQSKEQMTKHRQDQSKNFQCGHQIRASSQSLVPRLLYALGGRLAKEHLCWFESKCRARDRMTTRRPSSMTTRPRKSTSCPQHKLQCDKNGQWVCCLPHSSSAKKTSRTQNSHTRPSLR